ncbi:hypothetical protein Tco_0066730 [Tanacetum coccineum]
MLSPAEYAWRAVNITRLSTIYDIKSKLTQTALDTLCVKYHIPADIHPELPGPNQNVLEHFRINLSQLSVFGVAKISHFEILCRVHGFEPTVAMNLFSFIHHANPTKVRVGDMEKSGDQVLLLEATRRRVVPLAPPTPVTVASSEGNMTESIDRLFDEGNGAEKEHSTMGGEYVALTEAIVEPVNEDVAEKPRRLKKRKAVGDASGSTLSPKKLKDDYSTSGTSASTGGKSRVAMLSLLDSSKLTAKIRVTAAATMPLITSSVTPTPEREGGDHTDSVSGPNFRTKPVAVRSTVLDPPVMTVAVTTTTIVETSLVSVSKVTVKPVNPTLFRDSMSTNGHDVAGPSSPVHPELSADSFYAIQDLNPETLHRVYVPKWTITKESILDDPYMCHTLTDQLAPPALFSQLRAMEYDQLYTEFNVEQHVRCASEKDAEIASLKSQLSLKEVEATEAIRLRGHVATVEERNSTLEAKMRTSEEKATALESKKSVLTDQTTCVKLCNQVIGYELFKEQIEVVQDEQVRVLTEKIAEVDANLMGMALQLDDEVYPSYLSTIARRRWILSRGLKLGMQDDLVAGIEHGKAGRALSDVDAYNPSVDADYVAAVSALHDVDFSLLTLLASQKDASIADIMDSLHLEGPAAETLEAGELQPSYEQLMLSIHRPKDNVVLGETSLSFFLGSKASTFGVPIIVDAVTTLSTTFAQSVSILVPPLSVANYEVVPTRPQVEDPSSGGIVFEKEELETSPEPAMDS